VSKSESSDNPEKEIVAVTKHGQATIPKRFRDQLGIDAPGKVLFRETDDGLITVERVRPPSEMRGFATQSDATTDKSATQLLREKRAEDRADRDDPNK